MAVLEILVAGVRTLNCSQESGGPAIKIDSIYLADEKAHGSKACWLKV